MEYEQGKYEEKMYTDDAVKVLELCINYNYVEIYSNLFTKLCVGMDLPRNHQRVLGSNGSGLPQGRPCCCIHQGPALWILQPRVGLDP